MGNPKPSDDPREPSLEAKVTFPKTWNRESFAGGSPIRGLFKAKNKQTES